MKVRKLDQSWLKSQLYRPPSDSHKGQNGRLMVIGGSRLFHASVFWSADVASKIVDLVHFTSPANENNTLIRKKLKEGFWNGIVVDWSDVEAYIEEDDCILIGPGMVRNIVSKATSYKPQAISVEEAGKGDDTRAIVNMLLKNYPEKKWVVDGGALQELDPELLNRNMIITPHFGEWEGLMVKDEEGIPDRLTHHNRQVVEDDKSGLSSFKDLSNKEMAVQVRTFSKKHDGATVLLKGREDLVCKGEECVRVEGGNAGMTKGGTGDVLAGLVAALYCKNDAFLAAQAGSLVNKEAGEQLFERAGVYFNAGDLVGEAPKVLAALVRE